MSTSTVLKPMTAKTKDPNEAQRKAANPDQSVWVSASAGSGKTKVLTDRVLRLLLPRTDGTPGTRPEKILCLTFTKAGASEMALRINQTLALWATMPLEATIKNGKTKDGLGKILENLLGQKPSEMDIQAARRLFARVVDVPGGLKIMTIHAFCQSILGRFPLEAGLRPHFTVLSPDGARELMQQARDQVFKNAVTDVQSDLHKALSAVAATLNEEQFESLMQALGSERQTLSTLLKESEGADQLYHRLCDHLNLDPKTSEEELIRAACADTAFAVDDLRAIARILLEGKTKGDPKNGQIMADWLASNQDARAQTMEEYALVYLTKEGELRAKFASKDSESRLPGMSEIMLTEAERLLALYDKLNALKNAQMTHNLLLVGQAIIDRYQQLKNAQSGLDFDDMVNYTRNLLTQSNMAAWVLYKLDGGLDHILVDEAQDTNPEQWDIVGSLIREFFSGQGAREIRRTLFVVGDEKQSIFSFQRAAPDKFRSKRDEFKKIIEDAGQLWEPVPMEVSFRSTEAVLDFTDAVFSDAPVRYGVSDTDIQHYSFREGHAGQIELWPLFRVPKDDTQPSVWEPALTPRTQTNARALLAKHIAATIKEWITNGKLASKGRRIQAGDIMILVRNRNALVGHMIRELKALNIPVNGLDRMKLGDHIGIQDMMALAQFALLPDDDLSLACILKSPLINWNDQQLEDVAIARKGRLWDEVQKKAPTEAAWLQSIIHEAQTVRPYEFFSRVLQSPCPASTISGLHAMTARLGSDVIDPLDEFLSQVLGFEGDHISTVQGFVLWQQQNESEIKREQEEAGGRVRIMTVHASKGLQAPIVILPDTIKNAGSSGNRASDRLLWPAKTNLPFPLWSTHAEQDSEDYIKARERVRDRDQEEYRRLFYVALTRAEDHLYIGGAAGEKAHDEGSWYELAKNAFDKFEDAQTVPFVTEPAIINALQNANDLTTRRLQGEQQATPEDKQAHKEEITLSLPDLNDPTWRWSREAPAAEPALPKPLIPSQASVPSGEIPAALSPLLAQNNDRFRRGNLTHRLLQFLPDLSASDRTSAATKFAARYGHDLSEAVRQSVVAETMAILDNPEWADLFGPLSRAEVPITGLINGKLVSGQIDRLLITDDAVHIVDYKTNRPPPQDEKDIPDMYRVQLKAYRDTLAAIYPSHAIHTYLLWTDGPRLMTVNL